MTNKSINNYYVQELIEKMINDVKIWNNFDKIQKKLKTPNSTRPKDLTKIIVNKKFEKLTIIWSSKNRLI